jgi:hypothetical protein
MSRIGQLCLNTACGKAGSFVPAEYLAEATKCHIKGVFDMSPTIDFAADTAISSG